VVSSTHEIVYFLLPVADFTSVQDEALQTLMTSWYYAGYHTGFYEGQNQAKQAEGDVMTTDV
jgi:hypothetical protein